MGRKRTKGRAVRRERRNVPRGRVYVQASFNNTIITITDAEGGVLTWRNAGQEYTGSRKSTPFAAQSAASTVSRSAMDMGMRDVDVFVKGPGPGREAVLRQLQASGLHVRSITDVTPIPHNGCRPPKKRRI
jgi:small subunit ribosomal protein S11